MNLKIINDKSIANMKKQEINTIMSRCHSIAMREYDEEKDAAVFHNTVCPSCRKKTNVVNKINNVEGISNIIRNYWGDDKITMKISTYEVNHCNECGHEWKKFKTRFVNQSQILHVAFRYLVSSFKDENSINPESMRYQVLMVFKDMHAESIHKLYKENIKHLKADVKSKMKLSILRKHFPSIN